MFGPEEKASIRTLYGVHSDQQWKRPPTEISTPSNSRTRPSSSQYHGPFSQRRLTNNLHDNRGASASTVSLPANKRRKLSHDTGIPSTFGYEKSIPRGKPRRNVLLAPEDPPLDPITINDSEDEDIGEVIPGNDSRDHLDLIGSDQPTSPRILSTHAKSSNLQFPRNNGSGELHLPPPGTNIHTLGERLSSRLYNSDNISSFSDDELPPISRVKQMASIYDKKLENHGPKINLREQTKTKDRMRTAEGLLPHPAPLKFIKHQTKAVSFTPKPDPTTTKTSFKQTNTSIIPVSEFIIRYTHRPVQSAIVLTDKTFTLKSKKDPSVKQSPHLDIPLDKIVGLKLSSVNNYDHELILQLAIASGFLNHNRLSRNNNHRATLEASGKNEKEPDYLTLRLARRPILIEAQSDFDAISNSAMAPSTENRSVLRNEDGMRLWDYTLATCMKDEDRRASERVRRKRGREDLEPNRATEGSSRSSSATTTFPSAVPTRRSARNLTVAHRPKSPSVDPEELVLAYNQGKTGAVNLKNSDIARLGPGEYLNDTLIEFGLRNMLDNLRIASPELADQIHIFNSFFYKKLGKKSVSETYETVRRWTAKTDIFSKKLILVPINENVHWYLAVIYNPQHVLLPPPEKKSPTRTTRSSGRASLAQLSAQASPAPPKPPSPTFASEEVDQMEVDATSSVIEDAGEVERDLLSFQSSCTIQDPVEDSPKAVLETADLGASPSTSAIGVVNLSDDAAVQEDEDAEVDELANDTAYFDTPPRDPSSTASESAAGNYEVAKSRFFTETEVPHESDLQMVDLDSSVGNDAKDSPPSVSTASFYAAPTTSYASHARKANVLAQPGSRPAAPRTYGKSKGNATTSSVDPDAMEIEVQEEVEFVDDSPNPKPYIFILDSLGLAHRKAIATLASYLQYEAQDKKNLANTTRATGKLTNVPQQLNFSDCGLYLLHFAQQFASDPDKFAHVILHSTKEQARLEWGSVNGEEKRKSFKDTIQKLSKEWKDSQKQEQKQEETLKLAEAAEVVAETSDSEIEITEVNQKKPSPKGKKKASAARRIR